MTILQIVAFCKISKSRCYGFLQTTRCFQLFCDIWSDLMVSKKMKFSDWNLIKTSKTLIFCAFQLRVPIYCRGTCSFEQRKATHTSRESVRVTYRKKRTPKHSKNKFVNEKNLHVQFHQIIIRSQGSKPHLIWSDWIRSDQKLRIW